MKRFCFTLVFLFIVAISVSADTIRTINIQQTTINILPNDGSGDNSNFEFVSPGTFIFGVGGMPCFDWCSPGEPALAPGSEVSIGSTYFFNFLLQVTVRGKDFDRELSGIFPSSLNADASVLMPTNGKDFTVTVPASLDSPLTLVLSDESKALLYIPPGSLTLDFRYAPGAPGVGAGYFFSSGTYNAISTVPEPSTWALLFSGLGVTGWAR